MARRYWAGRDPFEDRIVLSRLERGRRLAQELAHRQTRRLRQLGDPALFRGGD